MGDDGGPGAPAQGQECPVPEGPGRGKNRVVTTVGARGARKSLSNPSRGGDRHGVPAQAKEREARPGARRPGGGSKEFRKGPGAAENRR